VQAFCPTSSPAPSPDSAGVMGAGHKHLCWGHCCRAAPVSSQLNCRRGRAVGEGILLKAAVGWLKAADVCRPARSRRTPFRRHPGVAWAGACDVTRSRSSMLVDVDENAPVHVHRHSWRVRAIGWQRGGRAAECCLRSARGAANMGVVAGGRLGDESLCKRHFSHCNSCTGVDSLRLRSSLSKRGVSVLSPL